METARVFFGLTAAVVVPSGLGWQELRPRLMVSFTLIYGLYSIAPFRHESKPLLALAAAVLVSLGTGLWHHSANTPSAGFSFTFPLTAGTAVTKRLGAATLVVAVGVSLLAAGATTKALSAELLLSDAAAVMLSALLIAVFGGGTLAKAATGPVRQELLSLPEGPARDAAVDLMSGSRGIGLLERGLLFAFLAAGQPEAAALVLAAKSLARVPAVDHGKHASEYFLIGTLASVIASLVMSMAARSAIGLSVL
ncbi:hypothetical protein ACIPJK_02855 [Streptomyces roseus]|uniref:hypothetical protein n=1 Tax=Streptomyces roseus TaxID=66430 RepID=UPI0037F4F160